MPSVIAYMTNWKWIKYGLPRKFNYYWEKLNKIYDAKKMLKKIDDLPDR